MLGAICGDVIGSRFEHNNTHSEDFKLFTNNDRFTDDTVMTCAIALASIKYKNLKDYDIFQEDCLYYMRELGRKYINAGYGRNFIMWLLSNNPVPYNSYGNGSAMRVSSVSYVSDTLEEAEKLAELSASVTHNHPEGIKGAKVIAGSIWLLNKYKNKDVVMEYVEKFYDINFKLSEIKDDYSFDVSCQGTVPVSIVAFLESNDFVDSIRKAISIGGDSDTIAAITGSLSEAYYGVPKEIEQEVYKYLDISLLEIYNDFQKKINNSKTL